MTSSASTTWASGRPFRGSTLSSAAMSRSTSPRNCRSGRCSSSHSRSETGGYLVLGNAETISPLPDYFAVDQPRLKIFRRYGRAHADPDDTAQGRESAPHRRSRRCGWPRHVRPPIDTSQHPQRERAHASVLGARADDVLLRLRSASSSSTTTTTSHSINNAAPHLLGIHGAASAATSFTWPGPSVGADLRRAVDRALAGRGPQPTWSRRLLPAARALAEIACRTADRGRPAAVTIDRGGRPATAPSARRRGARSRARRACGA